MYQQCFKWKRKNDAKSVTTDIAKTNPKKQKWPLRDVENSLIAPAQAREENTMANEKVPRQIKAIRKVGSDNFDFKTALHIKT
jgi:hypothetical protein